jgi:amino acid adenylation domain-containing protein
VSAELSAGALGLSADQLELLDALLAEEGVAAAAGAIPRRPDPAERPLSAAQRRLWFLDQLQPGTPNYNVPAAVRLLGRLDRRALDASLVEVARRHEALRATFPAVAGQPRQELAPPPPSLLRVVDAAALPPEAAREAAAALARREARLPFDLARGPLLRATLVELGGDERLLLLDVHHVVSDGWSMGIFVREMTQLYRSFAAGRPSPLADLPLQYADYAAWQRDWLAGGVLDDQLAYWAEKLAGFPTALDLPTDRPRPPVESFRGALLPLALPPAVSAAVGEMSRARGVSPFMTLLAAFAALLGRHSGQPRLLVGSPIAGRNRPEVEGLIGFFVNTLVLPCDLSGDPSFAQLLARVQAATVGAYDHQDLPFERLVAELAAERDRSRAPLFQVMFAFQNAPLEPVELPGMRVEPLTFDGGTAKFDLLLAMGEGAGGLEGSLEYATDLFDATTAARLVAHFGRLLAGAVAAPERPAGELPLLAPAERWQLVGEWNDTGEAAAAGGECLHGLVAAQAGRTPEATALVAGEERLSYAELWRRARELAARLTAAGAGPEVAVGVCLERRAELPVALLAVLAAGGAYLPLDPAYPEGRLALMLDDAAAPLVVTSRPLVERLPAPDPASPSAPRLLCLDEGPPPAAAPAWRGGGAVAGNLAYLIYTSGSTGRPKGVAIEHRSAVALVGWAHRLFTAAELAGVLAATSVCFDLSVFELFVPLARGGRVVLAANALALPALAAAREVTLVNTVPSAMAELVALGGVPASVRVVNLAGEPLHRRLVETIYAATAAGAVFNLYGPSEDTTYSTGARIGAGAGIPPIGRPIAGTRGYLLDGRWQPVPIGVPGELLLGGAGLARGYLGRPALTAERFVPDPLCGAPGERLYATGDLVRAGAAGEMQFLGRRDHQVKIRGFRIELGEIEALLVRHPEVREVAVLALGEGAGDRRLVAFVGGAEAPASGELRAFAAAGLPAYMVPSAFVLLPSLPLSPNGKIDRKALARLAADGALGRGGGAGGFVEPRSPVEQMLAGIWRELLGVERVGAHDSFFELGGHSLLATQVFSRLRELLDVELPLGKLFDTPVLADLAREVEAARAGGAAPPPPIAPLPPGGEPPLSFAQQRLWFLHRLDPASPGYNMPTALAVRGGLRPEVLAASLAEVVRRHQALRTTFAEDDGEGRQRIAAEWVPALPLVDLGGLGDEDGAAAAPALAAREAALPFDLERGPLLRATLLRRGPEEHLLLVTLHHVVSDGWSMGVLVRELGTLYRAFAAAQPSPLPELPVQYADFAAWQRRWLTGEVLAGQLAYWRDRLAGAPHALDLPTDRPRPPAPSGRGATCSFRLSGELAAGLASLGRSRRATPFMTLLAAFEALLWRYTRQGDLLVGSPVAGRNRREIEGLIGFFVNTLVMRGDLAGDPGFGELVARVRQTALGAFAHQDLPFERLVEELVPERDLSRSPLFQVMFVLQNAPAAPLELPGLTLELLGASAGTAKFDLTLTVAEDAEGLAAELEYATDLFDAPTVTALARHLAVLLEGAVADPELPLSRLPLLAPGEREELLAAGAALVLPSAGAREAGVAPVPGGRPLPGRTVRVVDPCGRLVPRRVPGEVRLGGPALARGFRRRPAATAAAFVPDPWSATPGARLFRTGKLGRLRPDGELELLGGAGEGIGGEAGGRPAAAGARSGPAAYLAPRTAAEEILAGLWTELLGGGRVGVRDNFFELGGHSLLAARLASRVRRAFGRELPLAAFFEAPTIEALARRLAAAAEGEEGPAPPPIEAVARGGDLPPSFAQERLWFLHQLEPGGAAYHMPAAIRLRGRLDLPSLAGTLQRLVARHESLRTSFSAAGGSPRQVIAAALAAALPLVDLGGLPAGRREETAERLAAGAAARPFDLARPPLFRALLLRTGAADHRFLLTVHHVIADGWSLGVLLDELARLYEGLAAGTPRQLPELPVQYADFAVWQRRWLAGEVLARQVAYWRQRLAGTPAALELPTDRRRPAVQSFRGATVARRVEAELAGRLGSLARREGATLFMTLVAAFQALLGRHSGQRDVTVGFPIAGRGQPELEGIVGLFLNTLVLRTDLGGAPSLRELLGRVREGALGAYAHQDVPFERLLEELAPRRDLSRTPLFQAFFNLLNFPGREIRLPGLALELPGAADAAAKFDLTLYAAEAGEGIDLNLVYNADLFDAAHMEDFLDQYRLLLGRLADAPEAGFEEVALLTPAAAAVLPDPAAPLAGGWPGTIEEPILAQARRVPGRIAAADEEEAWSYGGLAAAAAELAAALAAAGVGPGDVVAVYARRAAVLAPAVVGVLAAGAAFTLLDPAYPAERLAEVVRQARPRAWVDLAGAGALPGPLAEVLGAAAGCPRLAAPGAAAEPPDERAAPPPPAAAERLAYLAFTSGTTGRPKGIAGGHGPVRHFLDWHAATFGLREEDRFSLLSGLAHDPLLRDLFTPLAVGGTLLVPDPDQLATPGWLAAWMARRGVTVAHLTPAMAQLLAAGADGGAAAPLPRLRRLFFGGDVLTRDQAATLARLAPEASLVNFYGATETPQAMGWHAVGGGAGGGERVPVGRGIADVQLLVLTAAGGRAGIGEVGEIAVRTPYLALGYWGDPELTAERFATNPYSGRPGDRLYRTGDLGRYLPGGEVELLGRADRQVKVRGFRVEPAEIEAVLGRHPGVREAAVVLHAAPGGGELLAAFWVPREEAVAASALRQHLARQLPDYMVPGAFVALDALPLTPSRKVDRRALAGLPLPASLPAAGGGEPRTPGEEIVAGIFAEVLGRDRVGRDEDFFALGGHSLLATRVLSRLRDSFGAELAVRALFEAPTVAALTPLVEDERRRRQGRLPPPVLPVPRGPAPPLSFSQQRLWFLDRLDPGSAAYNMQLGVRLRGPLEVAALAAALAGVVARHEALRTSFPAREGRPVQRVRRRLAVPLGVVDLSGLGAAAAAAARGPLATAAGRRSFDLARGPLLRACLLRLGGADHALLATLHHIAADGWSLGILLRELAALYRAAVAGEAAALPPLPVQYADFAVWQRRWLAGEVREVQLEFWRRRLAGTPPLDLPLDRPRPPLQTLAGATLAFALPPEVAAGLHALARRSGATLFIVLLAGFDALLHRHSGQRDLAVGTPVAGRSRPEVEGLIGFFVNTLVLRADLGGDPAFGELVARVRETALAAYAHQDLPFEQLVEELAPERDLARTPLFAAMLALQQLPASGVDLGELAIEPLPVETATARFDLLLSMVEQSMEGAGVLGGSLEYATDLFDATTADRLLRHFATLLAGAVAAPERRLSELPLMAAAEARQLAEWNDTAASYGPVQCLHEPVMARAAARPEVVALVSEGEAVSYGELAARACALGRRLGRLGVAPGRLVGICAERSVELVVGLLAILEAGAAYLPLDPDYPAERLGGMVADAAVAVLVATGRALGSLPAVEARVVVIEGGREGGAAARVASGVGPDDPAYAIFTSGSTGRPKGTLNAHRGIFNRLRWMQSAYDLAPADRVLQKTPMSFDVSVWEFFWPLWMGAKLVLAAPGGHRDPAYLARRIAEEGVTTLHFVPSMLRAFLAHPHLGDLGALRRVIVSGEALPADLVEAFHARLGGELHNLYGPTEAAVDVTSWPCRPGSAAAAVPIGRPVANTAIHLLDAAGGRVPVGVAGELHIGGVQVGGGYLGRPALTAERFVPDPLGGAPGGRLYRTGDLARHRVGGEVEFLGRLDHQVKLRGFRIELGEIETALLAHPAVGAAVVVARGEGGERLLAAYLAPRETGREPAAAELRAWLEERLPEYMVPGAFVFLAALPLSPNGKVDRRALPAPAAARPAAAGSQDPRDGLELRLVRIFEEVLDLQGVGVEDGFFALGGHSLAAVRLAARIEAELGAALPLATLFRESTPAALAALLRRRGARPPSSCLVPLAPRGSQPPLFCIHPAGGNVLAFLPLARHLGPDQPLYGLQSRGLEAGEEPDRGVEEMARRYLAEVERLRPAGPLRLLGWSFGGLVAYEMARRLRSRGREVAFLALVDTGAPAGGGLDEAAFADDARWLADLGFFIEKLWGKEVGLTYEELAAAGPAAALARFVARLQEVGFLPADAGEGPVRRLVEVYKANLRAAAGYAPDRGSRERYAGPLLLLRAAEGLGGGGEAAAPLTRRDDPAMGWHPLTAGEVVVETVPGDHLTVLAEPHVATVAALLRVHLAATGAEAMAGVR